MIKSKKIINKKGAVSLFVVIFFSLLVSVLAFGFIRTSVREQQVSLTSNLSQSAYDAAQVGIEDAKRLLVKYRSQCFTGTESACTNLRTQLDYGTCNSSVSTLYSDTANQNEFLIKKDVNSDYNQAYTCVIIDRKPSDFLGTLKADETKVVPLLGVSAFDKIQVEWFTKANIDINKTNSVFNALTILPDTDSYDYSMPPVLSAKYIAIPTSSFTLSGLSNSSSTYSRLFMKPARTVLSKDIDTRDTSLTISSDAPQGSKGFFDVKCEDSFKYTYSCKVIINLGVAIDKALFELKSFYNNTDYRITLLNNTTPVRFNESQISVDSTGRASNVFRRIETRLEKSFTEVYPSSAVEITNDFCKDFNITNDAKSPFSDNCQP